MAHDRNDIHADVRRLLENGGIHDALCLLTESVGSSDPRLVDLLSRQKETYRYMVHYFVEGFADSGRPRLLSEIVSNLYFINDAVLRDSVAVASPDIYSSTLRLDRLRKKSISSAVLEYRQSYSLLSLAVEAGGDSATRKRYDEALGSLFLSVMTSFGASVEDYRLLAESVRSADYPFDFKAQIISALLMGNLVYFDRYALLCLLDIFESDADPRISARALVAIVLIISTHPDRVASDMTFSDRLSLWNDSIIIYRQLREVVMSLIRARDTERISSKMKNEVIPELMKLRPELLGKLRNFSETSDLDMLEANPEWEELLNRNGLGDKLKELTEMQMEGGDVMMMAFSNLKTYPFFNKLQNWFLPFDLSHSELNINDADGSRSFMSGFFSIEGVMCDSDKYSFALSMEKMPESQKLMISEKMGEQMEQLKEAMAERKLHSSIPEFDSEVTRYVRDLYRFFKLFRRKDDFPDPFRSPLDLDSLPFVSEIVSDAEILSLVGEFYFKRGYYSEALPFFLRLEEGSDGDSLLWEKIGYCYHSLRNIDKAVEWYRKAELVHPDSKWLVKKMALCLRLAGRYEEAAAYYAKALSDDPDNYSLLMSAGNCLLESDKVAEALINYYHADYVRPRKVQTLRAIAWGELMNGNPGKSVDYYGRILAEDESNATDYLNSGHARYLLGDIKGAIGDYRRAIEHEDYGMKTFEKAFAEDKNVICSLGGNPDDFPLILDTLKYEVEK